MKHYPLIFGPHGGLVAGNGFIARVEIRGRCLMEETDEDFFCVFGVNPGAVAGDGTTMGEAYHDFLERVRLNVFEIADEASDYDDFEAQVRHFVDATNRPSESRWNEAVARVRAGELDLEGVRREDAGGAFGVKVERVVEDDEDRPRPRLAASLNEPAVTHEDFRIAAA